MVEIILALILPLLLIVVITRVTFSLIGASIVTWMIILSVVVMNDHPWWLILLTIPSFLVGVKVAAKVLEKRPGM
ncbi:DUF2198 family protein [Bacillus sp. FJAT-45037]|uniref:DUF2198 family protein n=1 Tax=Bacillus sp. FJAT-45037 TaxID=2011007 RepID=UPI000C23CCFA|nr:DUF2198 family protein [Bacillus sp. FJAT-45037]